MIAIISATVIEIDFTFEDLPSTSAVNAPGRLQNRNLLSRAQLLRVPRFLGIPRWRGWLRNTDRKELKKKGRVKRMSNDPGKKQ